MILRPAGLDGIYPTIVINSGSHPNVLTFFSFTNFRIVGTTTVPTGSWQHIALTRSGTNTRLFLNGIQEGSTYTDVNNYLNGESRPVIAGSGYSPGSDSPLDGYIDELRIIKGYAKWTGPFTPPNSAYNDDGVVDAYTYLSCSRASIGYAKTQTGDVETIRQ